MTRRLVVVWLLCFSAAASSAMAQDRRLDSLFTGPTRTQLDAILTAARSDHLPVEPLVQRALEGGRRGVSGARVVTVVEAFADRLRTARSALGPSAPDADLVAAASVLYLGVDRSVLERLRDRERGTLAMPLIVMADIIDRGVPRDTAASIIVSLSDAHVADADYMLLRQSILLDIGSGAPPSSAATTRARGLLVARTPAKPPE